MRLEPYAVKAACTVPRGEGGRKAILSPDYLRDEFALDALVERLKALQARHGDRFAPRPGWDNPLLRQPPE